MLSQTSLGDSSMTESANTSSGVLGLNDAINVGIRYMSPLIAAPIALANSDVDKVRTTNDFPDRFGSFAMSVTVSDQPKSSIDLVGESMPDHVELIAVDPMYRLQWTDGSSFDYSSDETKLLEQIRMLSPGDVEGYHRFADYTRKVFEKGYVELSATPFLNFRDMICCAPDLMKLRADRSVYAAVSRFVKDERLRQAFGFHPLLVGGNPMQTSSIYTLIHWIDRQWGVFFPRGGTGALVESLVALFERLGGELRLNAPVEQIVVSGGNGLGTRGGAVKHEVRDRHLSDSAFSLTQRRSVDFTAALNGNSQCWLTMLLRRQRICPNCL